MDKRTKKPEPILDEEPVVEVDVLNLTRALDSEYWRGVCFGMALAALIFAYLSIRFTND
jgi:hypothetical protein